MKITEYHTGSQSLLCIMVLRSTATVDKCDWASENEPSGHKLHLINK